MGSVHQLERAVTTAQHLQPVSSLLPGTCCLLLSVHTSFWRQLTWDWHTRNGLSHYLSSNNHDQSSSFEMSITDSCVNPQHVDQASHYDLLTDTGTAYL